MEKYNLRIKRASNIVPVSPANQVASLDFYSLLKMCDGGVHTRQFLECVFVAFPSCACDLFRGNVQELLTGLNTSKLCGPAQLQILPIPMFPTV